MKIFSASFFLLKSFSLFYKLMFEFVEMKCIHATKVCFFRLNVCKYKCILYFFFSFSSYSFQFICFALHFFFFFFFIESNVTQGINSQVQLSLFFILCILCIFLFVLFVQRKKSLSLYAF